MNTARTRAAVVVGAVVLSSAAPSRGQSCPVPGYEVVAPSGKVSGAATVDLGPGATASDATSTFTFGSHDQPYVFDLSGVQGTATMHPALDARGNGTVDVELDVPEATLTRIGALDPDSGQPGTTAQPATVRFSDRAEEDGHVRRQRQRRLPIVGRRLRLRSGSLLAPGRGLKRGGRRDSRKPPLPLDGSV